MRVALGDKRDVGAAPGERDVVGEVDIVGAQEPAHDLVGLNFSGEVVNVERAVGILVGTDDQARCGIGAVDPDGGIVGVVAGWFGDDARRERRGGVGGIGIGRKAGGGGKRCGGEKDEGEWETHGMDEKGWGGLRRGRSPSAIDQRCQRTPKLVLQSYSSNWTRRLRPSPPFWNTRNGSLVRLSPSAKSSKLSVIL